MDNEKRAGEEVTMAPTKGGKGRGGNFFVTLTVLPNGSIFYHDATKDKAKDAYNPPTHQDGGGITNR
jgi:hypothetical protein